MDFRGWAVLSALFAGVTAALAKRGVESVPSNLAVAIRVFVVLAFAVGIAVFSGQTGLKSVSGRAWLLLGLSGVATGASWLCYFKALQLGPVSKVAPIDKLSFVVAVLFGVLLFRERASTNLLLGCGLIMAGVLVTLR